MSGFNANLEVRGVAAFITPQQFDSGGILGSNNESSLIEQAIDLSISSGRPIFLSGKRWKVPSLSARSLAGNLRIIGEIGTVLDGTGNAVDYLWRLTQYGVGLYGGLTVEGFRTLISAGDATSSTAPNTVTGAIPFIHFEGVKGKNNRRLLLAFQKTSQFSIDDFLARNVEIDGGWAGMVAHWGRIKNVLVDNYTAQNLNGSGAGVATGEAADGNGVQRALSIGTSVGLQIGCNNPALADQLANTGWTIKKTIFRNIFDDRAGYNSGTDIINPEVHGLRLDGANSPVIDDLTMESIDSRGSYVVADCEGLYVKSLRAKISKVKSRNAGRAEAQITLKGRQRGGADDSAESGTTNPSSFGYGGTLTEISVVNDAYSTMAGGVTIAVGETTMRDFQIEGCGGDRSASTSANRAMPVFISPGKRDHVRLENGNIKNSIGHCGIMAYCASEQLVMNDVFVDGVLQTATTATNYDGAAFVLQADPNDSNILPISAEIDGLKTRNIQKKGTGLTHLVLITGPASTGSNAYPNKIVAKNVKPLDATDYGIAAQTATVSECSLIDCDLSLVATSGNRVAKRGGTGAFTTLFSRNTNGFMHGSRTGVNFGSAATINSAAGAGLLNTTVPVPGLRMGDKVEAYYLSGNSPVGIEIISCRYDANDQARLTLMNVTGAAVDQGATDFGVKGEKVGNAF